MLYNIRDYYWRVGADAARVWSSARALYVPVTDEVFVAWKAAGGVATTIDSEDSLRWVFDQGGFPEGWYGSRRVVYTSLEWSARLSATENLSIATAAQTNAKVLLVLLQMASANEVRVTDQRTIDGVNRLVSEGVLTAARGKELLA